MFSDGRAARVRTGPCSGRRSTASHHASRHNDERDSRPLVAKWFAGTGSWTGHLVLEFVVLDEITDLAEIERRARAIVQVDLTRSSFLPMWTPRSSSAHARLPIVSGRLAVTRQDGVS